MEDEELAAIESAAYQRELELEYMEREKLSLAESDEVSTWEVTNGAF